MKLPVKLMSPHTYLHNIIVLLRKLNTKLRTKQEKSFLKPKMTENIPFQLTY